MTFVVVAMILTGAWFMASAIENTDLRTTLNNWLSNSPSTGTTSSTKSTGTTTTL